jgi:hypothetical protein
MHARTERNLVVSAGRRTGKSTGQGNELIPEALKAYKNISYYEDTGQRAEFWVVGPEYTDSEKEFRVFYNACRKLQLPFDRPGTYYKADSGDMTVSLWDGKFLFSAKSAKHPERLVGEGLHGVIMAEAAKMKESVWTKSIRPTLSDFNGWARFVSTPEGRNWFYQLWKRGQDPSDREWWSARFPSWYNTWIYSIDEAFGFGNYERAVRDLKKSLFEDQYLTREMEEASGVHPEIIALMRDLGETMFQQEIEARFGQYVGRVYADWDEEVHCRPLLPDYALPIYLATDYGWTNPFVVLVIQKNVFDDVFVLGEYYKTNRTDQEVADDVLADPYLGPLVRRATMLYPDPEDPKATNALARKWKVGIGSGTGGLQKNRIGLVRKWLKITNTHLEHDHPERRPKVFVDVRRCPNLAREMDAWRYPSGSGKRNEQEKPMDKDDHAPEALSRFFGGMYGRRDREHGPHVSKANIGR